MLPKLTLLRAVQKHLSQKISLIYLSSFCNNLIMGIQSEKLIRCTGWELCSNGWTSGGHLVSDSNSFLSNVGGHRQRIAEQNLLQKIPSRYCTTWEKLWYLRPPSDLARQLSSCLSSCTVRSSHHSHPASALVGIFKFVTFGLSVEDIGSDQHWVSWGRFEMFRWEPVFDWREDIEITCLVVCQWFLWQHFCCANQRNLNNIYKHLNSPFVLQNDVPKAKLSK